MEIISPVVFLVPVLLTVVLGLVGFFLAKGTVCQMPNLLLWTLTSLFILGPGIMSVIISARLKTAHENRQKLANKYK